MKSNEKKNWEKDRRDRLKVAFNKLEKFLPSYDPSNVMTRIKVVEKTTDYIQELKCKIEELLKPSMKLNAEVLQLKRSQERIKRLISRIELLTSILREAKIPIPKEGNSLKLLTKYKWSGKISEKTAVNLQKKAEKVQDNEKENKNVNKKMTKQLRKPKNRNSSCVTPQHRKTARSRSQNKNSIPNVKRCLQPATSNCLIIYTQACNTQPCYLVTNTTQSLRSSSQPVLTNQLITPTPLMSTSVKTSKPSDMKDQTKLPTIGPTNTLILTNVLPQSQPVLSTPIVLQLANSTKSSTQIEPVKKEKNVEDPTTSTSVQKTNKSLKIEPKISVKITNKIPISSLQPRVAPKITRKDRRGRRMNGGALSRSAITRLRKIALECEREEKKKQEEKEQKANEESHEKQADSRTETSKNEPEIGKISIVSDEILKTASNVEVKLPKSSQELPINNTETHVETDENPKEPVEEKLAENVDENMKNFNLHSELSNDIFASLQVPTGCQNPESTSPTAAFLLAFPLVSSLTGVKVTEVIDEDNPDSQRETPTLLQIGTIETKQTQIDNQNMINLDNLSFFSKDIYNSGFYNSFEQHLNNLTNSANNFLNEKSTTTGKNEKVQTKDIEMNYGIDNNFMYDNRKNKIESCKEGKNFVQNRGFIVQKSDTNKHFDNFIKKDANETLLNTNIFNDSQTTMRNVKSTEDTSFQVKQNVVNSVPDASFLSLPPQSNFTQNSFGSENYIGNQKNNNYNYLNYTPASKQQPIQQTFKDTKSTESVQKSFRIQQKNTSFNLENKHNVNVQKDGTKQTYPTYLAHTNYECTKVCTYNSTNKMIPEPLYTNSNNSNYNYYTNSETYPSDVCYKKNEKTVDFENFNNFIENNCAKNPKPPDNVQQKPYNNWMTTPKTPTKDDNTYNNYNQMYFSTPMYSSGELSNNLSLNQSHKKLELGCQKDVVEENHFSSWSPTKIPQFLDPVPNFSTSLPTLVGDLALGTNNFTEKPKIAPKNYENNNFFSVSQLVHNKDASPSKTVRRRNSTMSSKNTKNKKLKTGSGTAEEQNYNSNKSPSGSGNNQIKNDKNCRQNTNNAIYDNNNKRNLKVNSSSYSAEALIGGGNAKNPKNVISPFIPDNFPYFPPVELQQENYMQTNQNYQNFNTYSSNNFITTPYLTTSSNFMPELGNSNHEFTPENMNFPKMKPNKKDEKQLQNTQCNSISSNHRKVKKKPSEITPNFVDFSFLSVPGNINSPLLPDDFHTHANFLPPPHTQTLYPCKNALYPPKQGANAPLLPLPPIPSVTRTGIQHTTGNGDIPLNNVGTSTLTNFNLSTIFPEINKGSMNNDIYAENRVKEQQQQQQGVTRHYSNNSTISFNSQPIFTYSNCQTTQSYGIDHR